MHPARLSVAILVLAAATLLMPAPTAAGGEEPDAVAMACRGLVAGPLRDLRTGDETTRAAAEQALLARAEFALPYVVAAADSTADAAWRERCLKLSAALRQAIDAVAGKARRKRPEFPSWEDRAGRVTPRAPAGPGRDLKTARALIREERWHDAAETLLAFAVDHPERLAEAVELAAAQDFHRGPERPTALTPLAALARAAEDDARVALAFASWYRDDREKRLEKMVRTFPGTSDALRAEVRLIRSGYGPVAKRVERLLALADEHPGTEGAREALETAAFHYASSNLQRELPDPCDRFEAVARIGARLEGPEFPGSTGARAAVERLTELYVNKDSLSKSSAAALLAVYRTFFENHLLVDVIEGRGSTSSYHLCHKLTTCHAALGVPEEELAAAVDAELERLQAALPDQAGISYLRAERQVEAGNHGAAAEAFSAIEKAYPETLYGRKALAARAGLAYAARDFAAAETLYARYLTRYAAHGFAWLAALRIGHCRVLGGDVSGALHAYEAIDPTQEGQPEALVVHRAISQARCFERIGEIDGAVAAYREALAAWHPRGEDAVSTRQDVLPELPGNPTGPDARMTRAGVLRRMRWLTRPGTDPAELQRLLQANRLYQDDRVDEALGLWAALGASRSDSVVGAQAREHGSRVWVGRALALVAGKGDAADVPGARAALDEAYRAGGRFGRVAVALASAALLLREEQVAAAEARLSKGLAAYAASQRTSTPRGDLEADVAAVREAAFRPLDDRYDYGGAARQHAKPYVVVPSTMRVVLFNETTESMDLVTPLPECPNVLYFKSADLNLLGWIIEQLGASLDERDEDGEASSPPPGNREEISELLGRFFAVRPGHWGGWHLFAYPLLSVIRFEDAARSRAVVSFRVGYGGGEAQVLRSPDGWQLIEVEENWIE